MAKRVRVTEAKSQFSELMARVGYGGERFVIERRGKPLAALVGVEELERLEKERNGGVSQPLGAIALVGTWGEIEGRDLDTMVGDIYAERERYTGRQVDFGT